MHDTTSGTYSKFKPLDGLVFGVHQYPGEQQFNRVDLVTSPRGTSGGVIHRDDSHYVLDVVVPGHPCRDSWCGKDLSQHLSPPQFIGIVTVEG